MRQSHNNEILPKETVFDKAQADFDRIFYLGDTLETSTWEYIINTLSQRPIQERRLLIAAFTVLNRLAPQRLKQKAREKEFSTMPLNIPAGKSGKVMAKIGGGVVNTVYLLPNTERSSAVAVGIRRRNFRTPETALEYATEQNAEYKLIKQIYGSIDSLIPNENYVVYQNHRGEPNVMFIKDFIANGITDIFSIEQSQLKATIAKNKTLEKQIREFWQISTENKELLLRNQLDLLGKGNLAITGFEGQERLLLLDPHFRNIEGRTPEKAHEIEQRIDYLGRLVNDSNLNYSMPPQEIRIELPS